MKKLNDIIFDCLDWLFDRFSGLLIVCLGVFAVALVIMAIISYCTSEDVTVKLNLKNWECVDSKQYTTTTLLPSGKILIPITQVHNECVLYRRKI